MAGQSIRILPDEFTKEQHHRVGINTPDTWSRIWTYCMFKGGNSDVTHQVGTVFRDAISTDLLSAAEGTVTTIAAVDTNVLTDSGEFTNDDLRGAVGQIVEDAGEGQVFQVLGSKKDDATNSILIALIAAADGSRQDGQRPGWQTALAVTSKYRLSFPGRVVRSVAASKLIRGVLQSRFTLPSNETLYGWLLQRGPGLFRLDTSETAVTVGGDIRTAAGGLVVGGSNGTKIGTCTLGDLAGSTDAVIRGIAEIDNNDVSYRFPIKDEPYSRDDNGDLIL